MKHSSNAPSNVRFSACPGNAGGRGGGALWGHLRSRLPASGQSGVGVGVPVLLSDAVVDEALV